MLFKNLTIALSVITFASCERSSRNVQIQPESNSAKPIDPKDGSGDQKPETDSKKNGRLKLTVTDAPTSAKEISINWEFEGDSGSKTINLSQGTGSSTINSIPVGTGNLTVSGTLDGKKIKEVSKNVTIGSTAVEQLIISVKTDAIGPNVPNNSNGDADVGIKIDIGPSLPVNPPVNPANPPVNPVNPTGAWDGTSFKGNKTWSIELIP